MSLLSFFFKDEKKSSATSARERLQIIIAHEHNLNSGPEFLPALHRELIGVISKYVNINPEDVKISLDRQGNRVTLRCWM